MKVKYAILAFLIVGLFNSCDDIFIANLENAKVELVTPPDNFATLNQTQSFFWETLEDATEYHIRIVYPDFDNPIEVVVDETIAENSYDVSLLPGTYQWRVTASNTASTTSDFDVRTFHILEDSTLTNQTINILQPTDNFKTNQSDINVLWQPLVLASRYRIEVGQPDFSHSSFTISSDTTSNDNFTLNLSEGNYQVRVRAENAQSVSNYTTISLEIDQTAPTAPVLFSPNDGDTLTTSVDLTWSPDADAIQDTIYIYQDAQLTTLLLQEATVNTTYTFTPNNIGTYYWRLRSVDEVGNTSNYSNTRSVTIE